MIRVGVLGDGITAKAVQGFLHQSTEYSYSDVTDADVIVTSPGIPPRDWPDTTVEIISDIEFAYRILKGQDRLPKIIGVTGTNGKTTVASGLAHALGVTPYGNIGRPLISDLDNAVKHPVMVIELSSFQLFSSPSLHCDIGIIMNIKPDHLEWHESFSHYKAAKQQMIKKQPQHIYCPKELEIEIKARMNNAQAITVIDGLSIPNWPQFLGGHNKLNAALIKNVVIGLGYSEAMLHQKMASFTLPPYRCEVILKKDALTIVNDSKATNMAATLSAVQSFNGKKLLILCGKSKAPYTSHWMASICNECDTIFVAGELAKYPSVFPKDYQSKLSFYDHLKDATSAAIQMAKEGTILFSPSAASFDAFENYMDRGRAFNDYVSEFI